MELNDTIIRPEVDFEAYSAAWRGLATTAPMRATPLAMARAARAAGRRAQRSDWTAATSSRYHRSRAPHGRSAGLEYRRRRLAEMRAMYGLSDATEASGGCTIDVASGPSTAAAFAGAASVHYGRARRPTSAAATSQRALPSPQLQRAEERGTPRAVTRRSTPTDAVPSSGGHVWAEHGTKGRGGDIGDIGASVGDGVHFIRADANQLQRPPSAARSTATTDTGGDEHVDELLAWAAALELDGRDGVDLDASLSTSPTKTGRESQGQAAVSYGAEDATTRQRLTRPRSGNGYAKDAAEAPDAADNWPALQQWKAGASPRGSAGLREAADGPVQHRAKGSDHGILPTFAWPDTPAVGSSELWPQPAVRGVLAVTPPPSRGGHSGGVKRVDAAGGGRNTRHIAGGATAVGRHRRIRSAEQRDGPAWASPP